MKLLSSVIFASFIFFFCISCNQTENSNSADQQIQDITSDKGEKNRSKNQTVKAKPMKTTYWSSMAKDLNISAEKIERIQNLNAKNNDQIRTIKQDFPDNYIDKVKKLRISEKSEVKEILGNEMYLKKLEWDKKWSRDNKPAEKAIRKRQ